MGAYGSEKVPANGTQVESIEDNNSEKEMSTAFEEDNLIQYEVTDCRVRTWVNSFGEQWAQTIAEITNTGTSSITILPSSYDLEDSDGNLVASRKKVYNTYPEILAPGEKGYMYEEIELKVPVEGNLTVIPQFDVKNQKMILSVMKLQMQNYIRINMEIWKSWDVSKIQIKKTSSGTFVVGLLYEANGMCVDPLVSIITDNIAPGEIVSFEAYGVYGPDDINTEEISNIVYYAYPAQQG